MTQASEKRPRVSRDTPDRTGANHKDVTFQARDSIPRPMIRLRSLKASSIDSWAFCLSNAHRRTVGGTSPRGLQEAAPTDGPFVFLESSRGAYHEIPHGFPAIGARGDLADGRDYDYQAGGRDYPANVEP